MPVTINGSGTMSQMNQGGIPGGPTITTATSVSASGTSVDFTGIPSWVRRITVLFQGVSTNGASNYIIQLGTSAGVTTSGYTGQYGFYSQASSTGGGALSDGFRIVSNAAAGLNYGICIFCNISGNTWVGSTNTSMTSSGYTGQTNGFISLAGTLDRVRITTQNGTDTFDAGTINILYE